MNSSVKIIFLLMILLFASVPAQADQLPYEFVTVLGVETFFSRNENYGFGNMFCEWIINDYSGTYQFMGSYAEGLETPPLFDIGWRSAGADFPLNVTIASSGAGRYAVAPYYFLNDGDSPFMGMVQYEVVGNSTFGHYYQDAFQDNFQIYLLDPLVEYDLTVTMEWGTGVATDAVSWSRVKSLYR